MQIQPPIDPALLRRYDRPGPRYTSYPTRRSSPRALARPSCARRRMPATAIRSRGGCRCTCTCHSALSPCFYCGCNRIITRDLSRAGHLLARLYREIDLTAALFDRDREVIQLHFGGGTPNFLSPAQLREVVDTLRRQFHFSDSPTATSRSSWTRASSRRTKSRKLATIGFNRASLGVQDFDSTRAGGGQPHPERRTTVRSSTPAGPVASSPSTST